MTVLKSKHFFLVWERFYRYQMINVISKNTQMINLNFSSKDNDLAKKNARHNSFVHLEWVSLHALPLIQ